MSIRSLKGWAWLLEVTRCTMRWFAILVSCNIACFWAILADSLPMWFTVDLLRYRLWTSRCSSRHLTADIGDRTQKRWESMPNTFFLKETSLTPKGQTKSLHPLATNLRLLCSVHTQHWQCGSGISRALLSWRWPVQRWRQCSALLSLSGAGGDGPHGTHLCSRGGKKEIWKVIEMYRYKNWWILKEWVSRFWL